MDDAGERRGEAHRIDGVEVAGLGVRAEVEGDEPVALGEELAEGLQDVAHHPGEDPALVLAVGQDEEVLVIARVAGQGALADPGDRHEQGDGELPEGERVAVRPPHELADGGPQVETHGGGEAVARLALKKPEQGPEGELGEDPVHLRGVPPRAARPEEGQGGRPCSCRRKAGARARTGRGAGTRPGSCRPPHPRRRTPPRAHSRTPRGRVRRARAVPRRGRPPDRGREGSGARGRRRGGSPRAGRRGEGGEGGPNVLPEREDRGAEVQVSSVRGADL